MTEPQQGDFFVTQIRGLTGLGIRIAQRISGSGRWSRWTHAGVYVSDGMVLEAEPGGAVLTPLTAYEGRLMLWSTASYELTEEQRARITAEAHALLGVPYSFLDYLSIALHRCYVRPAWLKRYVQSTGHMICSQLTDEVYKRAGVHLFSDGRLSQDVIPADLAQLLEHRQSSIDTRV